MFLIMLLHTEISAHFFQGGFVSHTVLVTFYCQMYEAVYQLRVRDA
jgi:hypothetical protein